MESGGVQDTIDDISRGHKLSYEIKIVKISPVIDCEGLSEGFPHRQRAMENYFLNFSRKWRGWGQAFIHVRSRGHKLPYEIKTVEKGVVGAAGLVF
ncbi:hypothetical protein AVEN_13531-1 [Araneus ventricosus]|uniref:Uncharacterized protein n=1 Tax=Araneus ventricosus TaxID=182803 RepID=A0A4Y2WTV0_ARAVE|nr:hypothetical protein AVEN_13531-1 [Araneus ventricosus]